MSDLAQRAAASHVIVIGAGIGGLVAARSFAKVGIRVTLVEAAERPGGAIRRAELDGVTVDTGAESYATRGGHVRGLLDELGLADDIVTPQPGGAWLAGIPGADAAPLPARTILGIPENPFAEDVRRIIGWRGAWRAYVDRLRPPLTIGHEESLGRLVDSRMGARVRDRLVAPVTAGVYSAHPDDIDTDAAAPGLNAALTRAGSLSGAVGQLLAARDEKGAPGAAVEGIAGGMSRLVDALIDELGVLGTEVRTFATALRVQPEGAGWSVDVAASDDDAEFETIEADAVVLATDELFARALLEEIVPDLGQPGPSPEIEIVTLLLDAPVLDGAPRGSGVLTVPGSHVAKALTHSTAKWAWVREAAGDRHLVRVSFGSQDEPAVTAQFDDADAADLALHEAAALLGVPESSLTLLAAHRERFTQSQPASAIGAAQARERVRAAIAAVPGLGAVGAWLSGTGLAQVIPDAAAEAERVRHDLLWGSGPVHPRFPDR